MGRRFEEITSLRNARVKQVRRLRDKRHRERESRFVIEYSRDLSRALDQDYVVDYALYAPEVADAADEELLGRLAPESVFQVSSVIMQKASYRQNPTGLIAVVLSELMPELNGLNTELPEVLLALVGLKKPGNIGALLRTADAAGIDGIILIDSALDLYNPNIIRSSTGACFLNNIYSATSQQALRFFEQNQYRSIAAAVDADKRVFDADFRSRSVILLGTEDIGLDQFWLDHADQQVHIPMVGNLSDSLNVSVSGAIFMYEALRQRVSLDFET